MKCEVCKSNQAMIRITNVGNFCLDCNNDRVAESLGLRKLDDFERIVSIHDAEKVMHRFEISNMIMPGFSKWSAEEVGGGYQYEVMAKPEDNQEAALKSLHQKVKDGLGYKTLYPLDDFRDFSNAICLGSKQYGLHHTGTFRIEHDEDNIVDLIIDGKSVPLQAFGRALTSFDGLNMDFQMRTQSDAVLGESVALKRVSIHPADVLARFERTLGWFLNRGFLSYKVESACWEALVERIEDLELLYNYGIPEDAVEVARRIKERLLSIDHDTEAFPDTLLNLIDQAIQFSE